MLNPPSQYADDRNLQARQRLWEQASNAFDLVAWTLDLAGVEPGMAVLDVGCGNGSYLAALRDRGVTAVGCDLSPGMLRAAAPNPRLVNADVQALPFRAASFDAVLAPHMLYHVPDRAAAARELRRVLVPGGTCVAITNGDAHLGALRASVEAAVGEATPGWTMRNPALVAFSLENGPEQLGVAFESVTVVRPETPARVVLRDASIAADYVASVADHYEHESARPWPEVVEHVRQAVQRVIDAEGELVALGDTGAVVCR